MDAVMEGKFYDIVEPWLAVAVVVVVAVGLAFLAHRIVFAALERLTLRTAGTIDNALVRYAKRPAWLIVTLFAFVLVVPGLDIPEDMRISIGRVLSLLLTVAFGWLAFSLTRTINDVVAARYDLSAADNLRAREVHTRVRLLQRILAVTIVAVTASVILMAIPGIRQIGITLFASAGIAGIIAALAARPVLSNLFAGLQLALTQPIRIDDVVIVEGEWGWIEEIRMTFVVVRVWDLRRLIVPLSYFIETPFQNWTRKSADILGTVFLYTDYTVPVNRVREELHRILQGSDLWDGEVWGLQVTNTSERTVELRALMGARSSGDAWNLRCHVREELIEFLQREYPQALPRLRAERVDEGSRYSESRIGESATPNDRLSSDNGHTGG
jgi:small-conductance mechanosensitive channel